MAGDLNPVWLSVAIMAIGVVINIVAVYVSVKVALARFEERQQSIGQSMGRFQDVQDEHGRTIGDHGTRIRVLENEIDLRPPPVDYPRRA